MFKTRRDNKTSELMKTENEEENFDIFLAMKWIWFVETLGSLNKIFIV